MKSKYLTTIKARSLAVRQAIEATYNDRLCMMIPDNIDRKHLLSFKPENIKEGVWVDNCLWLIGQIYRRQTIIKLEDHALSFIPMSSLVMKSVIPNYVLYLRALIENGIILCDNSYSTLLHYTKGFRIQEPYSSSAPTAHTITNKAVIKRIRKGYNNHLKGLADKAKGLDHLFYWLSRPELNFDKDSALESVGLFYKKMQAFIQGHEDASKIPQALQALESSIAVTKYKIKNWNPANFSIDEISGRIYSTIVGMDAYLRCFLSFEGKPLVSLDIVNSQPFHILFFLKEDFWEGHAPISHTVLPDNVFRGNLSIQPSYSSLSTSQSSTHHHTTSNSTHMLPESSYVSDCKYVKTPTYKELVLDGVLYEYLSDVMYGSDIQDSKQRFKTRILTKYELLRMLYFDPKKRHSISKGVLDQFKVHFSDVAGLISQLKHPNYRFLPLALQKLESEMLLKRVASAIFKRNPNIPLFTIHDSILTTEEHLDEVKSIVLEEYRMALGHLPQLKETKLDPGNYMEFISKQVSKKSQKYARKYKLIPKELETDGTCENENFALAYMVKRAIKLYIDNPAQGSTPTMQHLYQDKNLKALPASKEDKSSLFIAYFKPLESFDDYHIHQCERFLTNIPQASSFLWITPLHNQLWMRNAS